MCTEVIGPVYNVGRVSAGSTAPPPIFGGNMEYFRSGLLSNLAPASPGHFSGCRGYQFSEDALFIGNTIIVAVGDRRSVRCIVSPYRIVLCSHSTFGLRLLEIGLSAVCRAGATCCLCARRPRIAWVKPAANCRLPGHVIIRLGVVHRHFAR